MAAAMCDNTLATVASLNSGSNFPVKCDLEESVYLAFAAIMNSRNQSASTIGKARLPLTIKFFATSVLSFVDRDDHQHCILLLVLGARLDVA